MTSTTIGCQSYVFDPRPHYPLVSTIKRYWCLNSPYLTDPDAFTLILLHGTNFHKEIWEPTIEDLFSGTTKANAPKVRDVWALDAPNHGDAALLNEQTLKWGYETFRWEEYSRLVHAFLLGHGTGVDVNFRKRRLIGVGHSSGGGALLLALSFYPLIRFEALVLVEPMIIAHEYTQHAQELLLTGVTKRQDRWPSQQAAYLSLQRRRTWKAWDDRVLQAFVCYGLRTVPLAECEVYPSGEVTLKCNKKLELAYYRDHLGNARSYQSLSYFASVVPINFVYGSIHDYISQEAKDDVIHNASGGIHNLASVSYVEGAGHLLPQTHPRQLAARLNETVGLIASRVWVVAKL